MNRRLLLAFLIVALPSNAALVFELNPSNGTIFGVPGDVAGWGFTFTPDDESFYLISSVEFCIGAQTSPCSPTLPGIGTFHDYASANLLTLGPSPIGHPGPYSESFVAGSPGTGIGDYAIENTASLQFLTGAINVYFDVYTDDTFSTQLPSGIVSQPAEIRIQQETETSVPEPTPSVLIAAGSALLPLCRRLLRRCRQRRRVLSLGRLVPRRKQLLSAARSQRRRCTAWRGD